MDRYGQVNQVDVNVDARNTGPLTLDHMVTSARKRKTINKNDQLRGREGDQASQEQMIWGSSGRNLVDIW